MGIRSVATRLSLGTIRFLQFCFAVIALGVTAYFARITHRANINTVREIVTPLVFAVIAIVFLPYTTVSNFFLSKRHQSVAAFIDFVVFVGFLASVGLYRRDFHGHWYNNPLTNYLVYGRTLYGKSRDVHRINALVLLLAAMIVLEIILFFISLLMTLYLGTLAKDDTAAVAAGPGTLTEKRGRFSGRWSRSGSHDVRPSQEYGSTAPVQPTSTV